MVASTILSMLFLAAVPIYQRLQRKARTAAVVSDFRVFATAFQAHAHEKGAWPAEAAVGVVPPAMTSQELKSADWTRATPIGGKFDWDYNQLHAGTRYRAAIAIADAADSPLSLDYNQFLDIDQFLDDGNLTTGNFRLGFGDCPLFIIEL